MRNAATMVVLAIGPMRCWCSGRCLSTKTPRCRARSGANASWTSSLPDFLAQYAREKGITVNFASQVEAGSPGRVLVMEFADVVSDGNAFLGHHKSVTVKGKLYQDGKQLGSFKGRRNSMGGAFGGFKGACSVLGRSVKALGEDIAGWLAAPSEGAQLGDLE